MLAHDNHLVGREGVMDDLELTPTPFLHAKISTASTSYLPTKCLFSNLCPGRSKPVEGNIAQGDEVPEEGADTFHTTPIPSIPSLVLALVLVV